MKASDQEFVLIDPAEALAELMAKDLKGGRWLGAEKGSSALRLLTTDTGSDLWDLARRILPKTNLPQLELVSITPSKG